MQRRVACAAFAMPPACSRLYSLCPRAVASRTASFQSCCCTSPCGLRAASMRAPQERTETLMGLLRQHCASQIACRTCKTCSGLKRQWHGDILQPQTGIANIESGQLGARLDDRPARGLRHDATRSYAAGALRARPSVSGTMMCDQLHKRVMMHARFQWTAAADCVLRVRGRLLCNVYCSTPSVPLTWLC
jgi:hypothetical protein